MAIVIPNTTGSSVTINTKNPGLTIKCLTGNRNWDIRYPNSNRQGIPFQKLMISLTKKFKFLKKYESDLISHVSKITHNRQCLEPLANMILAGSRDGKDDGRNQFTNHKRTITWETHEEQDVTKVSFLGDSWTDPSCYYSYSNRLARQLNLLDCATYNRAIGGSLSTDIKQQFIDELREHNPDMFIMTGGGNDFLSIADIPTSMNNIKYIIDQCISRNKKLIIVSYSIISDEDILADMLSYAQQLGSQIKSYVNSKNNKNVAYIDMYPDPMLNYHEHPEMFVDGVHLSKIGHEVMLKHVIPVAFDFLNLRSVLNTGSDYQPVWTIEEIYQKERVPSFIERTWEQMV